MAFLFGGIVFVLIGGTVLGSIIGLIAGLFITIVLPLTFSLIAAIFRGISFLLTLPVRRNAITAVQADGVPVNRVSRRSAHRHVTSCRNRLP